MNTKTCKKCEKELPIQSFYRNKNVKDGYANSCKACNGIKGLYTHATLKKIVVEGIEVDAKSCRSCAILKPLTEFPDLQGKKYGVGNKRANCVSCERKSKQKYYEENKERIDLRNREWYANNKEKDLESYNRWARQNKDIVAANDARRLAKKQGLIHSLDGQEWRKILQETFDNKCALTGESENVSLDHFIPLSTGFGGTYIGNVYPLSSSLNSSKGKINPFEWVKKRPDIDVDKFNRLVEYLAEKNNLSTEAYEAYVYKCFADKL